MSIYPVMTIDPGTERSGWALQIYENKRLGFGDYLNDRIEDMIKGQRQLLNIAIEQPKNYGAPVGDKMFQTAFWAGRFWGIAKLYGHRVTGVPRKTIATAMTGKSTAGDSIIRCAVLDCFPQTGGGKNPAIGTKDRPGALYGLTGYDQVAAIALLLTVTGKAPFADKADWFTDGQVWR